MTKINKRVRELMEQEGMDTTNTLLVYQVQIIYAQAQLDLLQEELKKKGLK